MSFFNSRTILALTGLLTSTIASPLAARDVTTANAEAAFNTLQQWYNQSTGIYNPSTGWWNSANCITVIAGLAAVDGNIKNNAQDIFSNTFTKAQQYNLGMAKTIGTVKAEGCEKWMMHSYYTDNGDWPTGLKVTSSQGGFLNDYYDDEGWWALGWIAAYDITGIQRYLQEAENIFADMQAVFGKTNCASNSRGTGGIWWDRPQTYVNAIANELYLSVAAHLANRVGNSDYLTLAKQQWEWFQGTGMINSQNLINDGLDASTCQNNNGTVWSYNQGVILGGLAELSRATGDGSYITRAQAIADAAIASLASDGILRDPCEPDCGGDGPQFKGVFARNLMLLQQTSPQSRYATFLENNANSIWNNDRNGNNELGLVWAGPFIDPTNAAAHSSAMDALVGALAT